VLSVASMRAWERATWATGVRESEVIERVGRALAGWLRTTLRDQGRVLLLCGRGHNGDDVRAALPHLGPLEVRELTVLDPGADLARVEEALGERPDLIVDGLFGIGLNRPLDPAWQAIVGKVVASGGRVVAMDVPSGLDADSGTALGAAIIADWTLTVGAPKRGLLTAEAVRFVGRLEVLEDVGLVPWSEGVASAEGWFGSAAEFQGWPPRRAVDAHKGDFGHVCIVAGSLGFHGAAVLAARAALRARPGLVTVITAPECYVPVASQLDAAMVLPWSAGMALPARTSAVVVGPGLADPRLPAALRDWISNGWREWSVPVLADASALDGLPVGAVASGGLRVLTPHPGEAARLLGVSAAGIQRDRVAAMQAVSERHGAAVVVLKGSRTVVGRAGEPPWWNPTGNPGLAQGGSGDVLAGFLGGLLAQPAMAAEPMRAIRGAVFHHGAAADRLEASGEPWDAAELSRAIRWG
jgi:ADP-dependent NAD(P)H-hydrate dehydratase / NAD(P)H-hydrate epimerase